MKFRKITVDNRKSKQRKLKVLLVACIISIVGLLVMIMSKNVILMVLCMLVVPLIYFLTYFLNAPQVHNSQLLASGMDKIDRMSGEEFEEYLAAYFESQGYKVKLTRASGDYGADIIVERNGFRMAIQAKRYSDSVGVGAVQEIAAAVQHYKADRGAVMCTSTFTASAQKLAKSNKILLMDRNYLIKHTLKIPLLDELDMHTVKAMVCPKCGLPLITTKWDKGSITHCANYPKCNFVALGDR